MKVSRNQFAIAGIVGALAASGAIATGASSFAADGTATSTSSSTVAPSGSATPSSGPTASGTTSDTPSDVPVDVDGITIRTSPGPCSPTAIARHQASMTITVTVDRDRGAGRLVAYLQSRAAAGSWSYDLGPATAGSHTVNATWESGYATVVLGVSYLNAGMSHNAGVVDHPRFGVCGESTGPSTSSMPTAPRPSNEPPTPSPVTTRLGVTG